jgi:ABC-type antimicrobial peptide transport system permease subunit
LFDETIEAVLRSRTGIPACPGYLKRTMTGKNACPTVMPKRIRRLLVILLLLIIVWTLLAWIAARSWLVKADMASADALVVLSGSSSYLERTHQAAEL